MQNRLLIVLVCGVLFGVSPVFGTTIPPAAVPCTSTTLDAYVASGEIGCSLGGEFDASTFTFSASAGAPLAESNITVTPTVTSVGGVIVAINFNFSGNFSNSSPGPVTYTLNYILDPSRPVILGAGIGLDPSGVLTEQICAGGAFVGSTCSGSGTFFDVLVATGAIQTASTAFPNGVNIVDYQINLTLQPGDSAGGFDSESITGLGGTTNKVPEPSSMYLLASGLFGFIPLLKRSRS